jgi:AraC-like DNA-binding protein
MEYFDDLSFINGDIVPGCKARIDCRFEGMFNLQFIPLGPMSFSVDRGPERILRGPHVFWHHPDHHYKYSHASEEGWLHYWMTFRGERAARIMEKGFMRLSPAGYVKVADAGLCGDLFSRLVARAKDLSPAGRAEGVTLLERILLLLWTEAGRKAAPAPAAVFIRSLTDGIESNPLAARDFRKEAAKAGLSYSRFRRLFKDITGMAPGSCALGARMRAAAAEIASGGAMIKEAAAAAGYTDPSLFSKMFRRKIGVSPEIYRDLIRGSRPRD